MENAVWTEVRSATVTEKASPAGRKEEDRNITETEDPADFPV